ncbi:MAG: sensor histidine kinase [Bacillota bacterium]|nr:sensor histidine kinase [Bacillota bacterium]
MFKFIKKVFRFKAGKNAIRKRLFMYFLVTTALTSIVSVYTYINSHLLATKMNTLFNNGVYLSELGDNLQTVQINLESYLSTSHSESLNQYYKYSSKLKDMADSIKKDALNTDSGMLMSDIGNMIETYLDESLSAMNAKRGRNVDEYNSKYNESSKIYGYINSYIDKLRLNQFQDNTNVYLVLQGRLNVMQTINVILILAVAVFNILLIIWFTYYITEPIIKLSKSANEIAKGNYRIDKIRVNTNDELSVLAETFVRMAASISNHVEEIKKKAELESQLKEQEMQNLKMRSLLKEAELQSLQAQINPHFMFNTLNAGVQIAMFEGADRTESFMKNLSELFRYNLGKFERTVTLKQEIENIESYIYILKERFADKIEFIKEVDETTTNIKMPRLILQPIVENAFMHGIGENENGGTIILRTVNAGEEVHVEIEDNGKGIEEETIAQILSVDEDSDMINQDNKSGKSNGIGMRNVINRLRLYFNKEDVIEIKSQPGTGTCIIIKLPLY